MAPTSSRTDLLESISASVRDYRLGEIQPITPERVDHWASQFDPACQLIILEEVDRLLQRFYFSRTHTKRVLQTFIDDHLIGGRDPVSVLATTHFLRIQEKGGSQAALLRMIDEILRENYSIDLESCGSKDPDTFVYVDDGIYSGNRMRYDLTGGPPNPAWITRTAPLGCSLKICVLASHSAGEKYAMANIRSAAATKQITVSAPISALKIKNDRRFGEVDCLWPREITGNSGLDSYVAQARANLIRMNQNDLLFRPAAVNHEEVLFSSVAARDIVEREFLTKGLELVASTTVTSQRPLGFEVKESLGFGSLCITYRNIANNTPPVLWWRGRNWQPLFQRRG